MRHRKGHKPQPSGPSPHVDEANPSGLRRRLRGLSYSEGQQELSARDGSAIEGADRRLYNMAAALRAREASPHDTTPVAEEEAPTGKPDREWTPAQLKATTDYNLKAHSISMLARIRSFLIENSFMSASAIDGKARVDLSPEQIVDRPFIEAVAYFQGNRELGITDGKIGPATFAAFEGDGFEYTLEGGEYTPGRGIVPKNAPSDQVFDYFRDVILEQGGVFTTTAGHMNIVGVRGGQLADGEVKHVENKFNKWNDTVVVLSTDADGKKSVLMYEGTTDPGVARKGVATIPEGTHSMELGWHGRSSPNYSAYPALNPANEGQVPVFRDGESYLGQGAGSGSWLNMHTTHGYDQGALAGPGGYSLGCTVINGQDEYDGFIAQMKEASRTHGQEVIYYTVVSASRLESMVVKSQSPLPHTR